MSSASSSTPIASSSAVASSSSSAPAIPAGSTLVYAINAGGDKTTLGGVEYQADRFFTGTGGVSTTPDPISGATEATLYQSQHYGTNKYEIPVTNSTYSVKLHFAEIYHEAAGARLFSLSVEGQPVIQNIDLYKDVGPDKAYDVIVPMIMVADKSLTIELTSQIDNATISGFAIYSKDGGKFVAPVAPPPPITVTPRANTLFVQLDQVIRPVTHVASGALYGVVEHIPADITALVAPLKPKSYVQPALAGSGRQQPYGGAMAVSQRLAGVTNATVTVRLADVLPGWPYRWPGWASWEATTRSVVSDKLKSGRNNYYGYEIWNEPYGTWQNTNGDFFSTLWKPTYDLLRSIDPKAKIIGPSLAFFSQSRMEAFLTYCKANNCLPDITAWHQWGSATFTANIEAYRAMEKRLGISPRLIAINEYSDDNHDLEGAPGVSAPFIAKFERHGVDTANISWWFPPLPGRLGSLITAKNEKNGGWWFYKWYGDMSGDMVKTTPPNDKSNGLDGFANIDVTARFASVALGGNYKGKASVEISGIPVSFGSTVNVKVEHVEWSSKETPVSATVTDSQSTYTLNGSSITVPVNMTNPNWGYRVYITP